jgi:hypothetical protein
VLGGEGEDCGGVRVGFWGEVVALVVFGLGGLDSCWRYMGRLGGELVLTLILVDRVDKVDGVGLRREENLGRMRWVWRRSVRFMVTELSGMAG